MTYEAFLYLNNLALTLLERHQYQESMKTFQDAIRVHQCFCKTQHQQQHPLGRMDVDVKTLLSKNLSLHNDAMIVQEKLKNASERLVQSTWNHQTMIAQNHIMMTIADPMIVIDIANDDCFIKILQYGSKIDQIDFMIRISDYDLSASDYCNKNDNRDWILHYAILMLNFGVACKRSSEVITNSDGDYENDDEYQHLLDDEYINNLRYQSIQLFHIANRIVLEELSFAIKMNPILCNNNQDNLRTILHTIMISMLTSSHLSDMMYWCHSNDDEAIKYSIKFENFYQLFTTLIQEYINRCDGVIGAHKKHAAVA